MRRRELEARTFGALRAWLELPGAALDGGDHRVPVRVQRRPRKAWGEAARAWA